MHPLLQHINNRVPFRESDFKTLLAHFERVTVSKRHQLIVPDEQVRHQYFVVQGCLRTFLVDPKGKEHTIQFGVENWWVSDYISYYREVPALLHIECLETCVLLKIAKPRLLELMVSLPGLETYFRKQLEGAFVAFQTRILSSLYLSAEERYRDFTKLYPDIEQRVKNYQIASFLGITPESLSRIRKQRLGDTRG